jgi:2-amino-4-hydroxy-6-hydroxymethyldihydropteridine diphosphokinase
MSEQVHVALGGNLGPVMDAMRAALQAVDDDAQSAVDAVSPVYRTPPWGIEDQPDFLNACARLTTQRSALSLLGFLKGLERDAGRVAAARYGPRALDLDILVFGDQVIDEPGLTVPHPRLCERAFVLIPLADIAPDLKIGARRVSELALRADADGMERLEAQLWPNAR